MGRKDTIAAKSIRKMYEQLNLNQSDIFSKTKLLLGVYRDVVWITLSESARVNEELAYYGEELDSALVYLELFAPDTEKQEFESRISALFENKWMVDLIDTAMAKIYDYHNNGRLYHEIISKSYLTAFRYTESELLDLLNMERSTFYDRKREAILLLGVSLWRYIFLRFWHKNRLYPIRCKTCAGNSGRQFQCECAYCYCCVHYECNKKEVFAVPHYFRRGFWSDEAFNGVA